MKRIVIFIVLKLLEIAGLIGIWHLLRCLGRFIAISVDVQLVEIGIMKAIEEGAWGFLALIILAIFFLIVFWIIVAIRANWKFTERFKKENK